MFANRRFQFHPILTIVVGIAFVFLLSLGNWQLKRLAWKQDLIAKVEVSQGANPIAFEEAAARADAGENMEYTPVRLTGSFRSESEQRVFGSNGGRSGVFVFAPLQTLSGDLVFVNQGFVANGVSDWECFCGADAPMEIEVTGLFRNREKPSPPASWIIPSTKPADGLWLVRDPLKFAAAAKIEAQPYYVDSFAVDGVDWPKGGTTRLDFSNRHLDYALTWFAAAAALIGVWLVFSLPKQK